MSDYKMIVIDDDIGVIDVIKDHFKNKYDVEGYVQAKEGIKRIKDKKFDLLVLDYFLEKTKANAVVEAIRDIDKEIYILLLTGYKDMVPGLDSLATMDIQGYCEKSAVLEDIYTQIEAAIKSIAFGKRKISFPQRLRELRKFREINQDELARYLGVGRTTITNYESGEMSPPIDKIIKLAEYFNVTVDFLLGYEFNIKKI